MICLGNQNKQLYFMENILEKISKRHVEWGFDIFSMFFVIRLYYKACSNFELMSRLKLRGHKLLAELYFKE